MFKRYLCWLVVFISINLYSMTNFYQKIAWLSLISIFLVIIAGSVVRMTGSGMGCPDWPKCFGYLIPPTDVEPLTWKEGRAFETGQMIIKNEQLLVAQTDFISIGSFDSQNWKQYEKHDYAIFNPVHTWIEYINRLLGAFSGLPVLILFGMSFLMFKRDKWQPILAFLVLIMLAFEAWLGKLVVDGNLIPGQITIHMMGAIAIVGLLIAMIARLRHLESEPIAVSSGLKWTAFGVMLLSLVQIVLGTQVREAVDVVAHTLPRGEWIEALPASFEIHRSFAILVIIANAFLYTQLKKQSISLSAFNWVVGLLALEIIVGVVLSYASMPAFLQPVHLLSACLLFAFQLYTWLRLKSVA